MDKETQILVLRDNAKAELLQIATIEQGLTYLNKVKALETWAEAEKKDAELVLIMAEQRIRTQGTIGRLIKEAQESGELLKKGQTKVAANQHGKSAVVGKTSNSKTLDEIGIASYDASDYRRIATIPQDRFEEFISEKKEVGEKPSTAAAVRLADEISGKKESENSALEYQQKVAAKAAIDERIVEMLKEINKWPKLYRMKIKQGIK